MKIRTIKNKIITDFIHKKEIQPHKSALLSDIINTLNPSKKRYTSKTFADKFNDKNHKVFITLTYHFKSKISAYLFRLIFKHIVLKNQFLLSIEQNDKEIIISLKEGILINHREKFSKEEYTIKKMEESFAYKEDSQLISEIFLNTLETIFFSDIYQDNNDEIKDVNQKILAAITSAIDDRVEYNSGRTLFNNILNYINKDEPQNIISTDKSMIFRLLDKINEILFEEEDPKEFVEKKIENRYL